MAKGAKTKAADNPLLSALRFVELAQQKEGAPYQTHCRITPHGIVAYDGVIAAGIPHTDELPEVCPNTYNLIHALDRARGSIAVTVEDGKMTIKASKFTAVVPVMSPLDLQYVTPDAAQYPLTDDFRDAATKASVYTKEGAQTVVAASVLTRNGSLVGTNGNVVVEAWHGIPTPPGLVIPKRFIDQLAKLKKKIAHFGFTDTTLTIWFDDGCWLKTQLYSEPWPNIDMILAYTDTAIPQDIPKDFWEGVNTIEPFAQENRIYFSDKGIRSNQHVGVGADYNVKGLPDGQSYNIKYLLALEKLTNKWDFTGNDRVAVFFGDRIRGAISKSS